MDDRRHEARPDQGAIAHDLAELAAADKHLGRADQSIRDLQEATDRPTEVRGAADPATVSCARMMADLMDSAGRPAEAAVARQRLVLGEP